MDCLSLFIGIASIVISLLAIWLSLYHKKEADEINSKTTKLLIEIKSDAKTISQFAMPELGKWNDTMRAFISKQPDDYYDAFVEKTSISIGEIIADFKNEMGKITNTENLSEIKKEVEKIRLILNDTEKQIQTEIEGLIENIEIVSPDLKIDTTKFKYNSFANFQSLLNELYVKLLHGKIPAWSYGVCWILINANSKEVLNSIKHKEQEELPYNLDIYIHEDDRSLAEAGIKPGDKLYLKILASFEKTAL